jgi:hypothetical protein
MSHFAVLVMGEDVAAQLQPYHEYECTGINDQYVQEIDITAACLATLAISPDGLMDALERYGLQNKIITDAREVDRTGAHRFGYAIVRQGRLINAVKRTNPDKKWDWWQIGGRWTGFFRLKPGAQGSLGEPGLNTPAAPAGSADSARKGDIDFAAMRAEAALAAEHRWETVRAALGDSLDTFIPWSVMCERMAGDVDQARRAYHGQEAMSRWRFSPTFDFTSVETYLAPRETYVAQAARDAVCTVAVIKDRTWYERAHVGWWGMIAETTDEGRWSEEYAQLLNAAADETLLTVVDCHT